MITDNTRSNNLYPERINFVRYQWTEGTTLLLKNLFINLGTDNGEAT